MTRFYTEVTWLNSHTFIISGLFIWFYMSNSPISLTESYFFVLLLSINGYFFLSFIEPEESDLKSDLFGKSMFYIIQIWHSGVINAVDMINFSKDSLFSFNAVLQLSSTAHWFYNWNCLSSYVPCSFSISILPFLHVSLSVELKIQNK